MYPGMGTLEICFIGNSDRIPDKIIRNDVMPFNSEMKKSQCKFIVLAKLGLIW